MRVLDECRKDAPRAVHMCAQKKGENILCPLQRGLNETELRKMACKGKKVLRIALLLCAQAAVVASRLMNKHMV